MKLLDEILEAVRVLDGNIPENVEIEGLAVDSRKVKDGYLFIALKGVSGDGHNYINKAIENGARAILVTDPNFALKSNYLRVENSSDLLGDLANLFFGLSIGKS